MNINATLFVQAINFFIAYLMVRYILLRPAVKVIQNEAQDNDDLNKSIDNREQGIERLEEDRKKQWIMCQHFFKQHRPDITDEHLFIFKRITPHTIHLSYPKDQIEAMSSHVRTAVLQAIRKYNDHL